MRFNDAPEIAAFRDEVRGFLRDEVMPRWPADDDRTFPSVEAEHDDVVAFNQKLASRGWLAMAWPEEYGGRGAGHMEQVAYQEELAYAGYPVANMGILWVGPSLMLFGTDEQRRRFLPGIASGDDWWCTLYSEPGAGSDLAALQASAVRDGDDYIINGQKIWTSGGHLGDWGWMAVRTDPNAPKHRGITLVIVDMRSPGVTVRPLINLPGKHWFNEVFFEDVRIPATNVVGELNRGWYHLAVALDFERSGIASFGAGRRAVERLVGIARERPELVADRTAARNDLADRALEIEIGRLLAYRVAVMQSQGLVPNHEASTSRLFGAELSQRIARTGMRLLGTEGLLRDRSHLPAARIAGDYLGSVSSTVAAGTSEIQRGIIATRGLGLPRE